MLDDEEYKILISKPRWEYVDHLVLCSRYSDKFLDWWKLGKFDYRLGSGLLCIYCYKYFNIWWDLEKFNFPFNKELLIEYCNDHFDKWWDPQEI